LTSLVESWTQLCTHRGMDRPAFLF
jgi:hypothetical protein